MHAEDKDKAIEKEIDLLELAQKLWLKKRFIGTVSLIGLVLGVIIAFSIPKEYSTAIILAPESTSSGGSAGGMGALAAMAGINLQQNTQESISPDLYPNIVNSTPFIVGLFDINVKDEKNGIDTDLYTYLEDKQKKSWWGYIFAAPSKILKMFSSKESPIIVEDTISSKIIKLSPQQTAILKNIKERISISVEKKTGTITLSSTMQSPEISAYIADTVTSYLQTYIINYRTRKARQDLAFTEKLYDEAKADYYKAQQSYATYSDGNLDVISARYGTAKERLQNEMNLAYQVYNQMAQQLQMAKVKVQDTTPVYTIIQPSEVPLIPEKPKKKLIVLGFIFLAFVGACSLVLVKEFFLGNKKVNN